MHVVEFNFVDRSNAADRDEFRADVAFVGCVDVNESLSRRLIPAFDGKNITVRENFKERVALQDEISRRVDEISVRESAARNLNFVLRVDVDRIRINANFADSATVNLEVADKFSVGTGLAAVNQNVADFARYVNRDVCAVRITVACADVHCVMTAVVVLAGNDVRVALDVDRAVVNRQCDARAEVFRLYTAIISVRKIGAVKRHVFDGEVAIILHEHCHGT